MQAALEQAFPEGYRDGVAGRQVKFKLEKDALNVSLDPFHGAVIRQSRTGGIRSIDVTSHMPAESPLEIGSSLIAFLIYQSMGRVYGLVAIVIAIGWPILLGQLISKTFAVKVAGIVSKVIPSGAPAETVQAQAAERAENGINVPKTAGKTCPKCGHPIRLANDMFCRKCGEKLR
jgi:hypothetical protein